MMMRRATRLFLPTTVALACAAGQLGAQRGAWRPDDRVLITDFSRIGALATDQRRVFAATPDGIAVFDASAERWLDPITAEDGYPLAADPTALAYDPVSDELWLATVDGRVLSYSPFFGRWRDEGLANAPPVFDIVAGNVPGGGVLLRESRGWTVLERGALRARPIGGGTRLPPIAVEPDPLEDPRVRARGRTVTVDEAGRAWPVSDAVTLIGSSDIWIGSYGGYLFRYSDFDFDTRHYVYGVPGRGVGALRVTSDAVWFGGDGRGRRRGVARADHHLEGWLQWESRVHGAPGGRVHDMAQAAGRLWVAAEDGLYTLESGGTRWERLGTREGLPDDAVLALAPADGGVWVGTARGAAFVDLELAVGGRGADGTRVAGVAIAGPDLWLATDRGVLYVSGGAGGDIDAVPGRPGDLRVGGRARSVAVLDGAVYAAFDDGVRRVDRAPAGPTLPLGRGGRDARLRAAGGRLWLAAADGVRGWDPATGDLIRYDVGSDIPSGPAYDVDVGAGGVWVATPLGALLLRDR